MRTWLAPLLVLLALATLAACNDSERVDLVFRADPGARTTYDIAVDSTVITRLTGPPEETREQIALTADQVVVDRDEEGTELEITMTREGAQPRVFEVRLDTTRGLAEVDAVEGLPVEALGELGPSRLILLASGLLPGRPLRPGGEWEIERDLELPEGRELLTGTGRLESLRVEDGVDLARVRATTALPVDNTMTLPEGRVRLSGTERTTAVLDYAVDDGTIHRARSVTTGRFDLVVTPPAGGNETIEGSLEVRVESRTTRAAEAER
ncbi:MAG: hypothetical protein HYU28_11830 [Actinobacteria bacterium]|nr:hypothetical protein [Actinomycetota bacterium]